jgi:catechol 2,3-dioxygenase-like lactoylglutathione lyase family enzyme
MSRLPEGEKPRWRGVNHLALVTADMDATVRFYDGVLGMRLVATTMAGPMRHYFFEIGPQNTIAFFEWPDAPQFEKPAGIPDPIGGQFDHLSFNLPDEEALLALRKRLLGANCGVTDVVDHGFIHSVYFHDNNGIALEASCWVTDGTGRDADYGDPALFGDPTPVPAVAELRADGAVRSTPETHLAGDWHPAAP